MFALKNVFVLGRNFNSTCFYPNGFYFCCVAWLLHNYFCLFYTSLTSLLKLSYDFYSETLLAMVWNYEFHSQFFFIKILLIPHVMRVVDLEMCFFCDLLWNSPDRLLTFCFLICKILLIQWTPTILEVMLRAKSTIFFLKAEFLMWCIW